jgi:glucose/mannose-6-phosphate isomerase
MRDAILSIGKQLRDGIAAASDISIQPYRRIVACGMGGSSIPGEILSMLDNSVVVHWDYGLPVNAGKGDLVICTSWSGNTEEVISSWRAARELGLDTLAITSGGQLSELAKEAGTSLIHLPSAGEPPRAATGYMVGALLKALGMEAQLPESFDPANIEEQGEELAGQIGGKALAIYASHKWRKLTGFWKMAYSETTKRQVMANWFPSGAHTEVVGWEGPYQDIIAPVLFREEGEEERYAKNFEALLAILSEKGYTVHTVSLSGATLLEKVFNNYLLGLWTGYHVATSLGVDPQATLLLDEFKQLKAKSSP